MRANSRCEARRLTAALLLSTLAAGSLALDRPKRGSHVVIPLSGRTQAKMTAYGLNNGGDIVGSEGSGVGERAVFRYRDGTFYTFTGYSGSSRLLSVNDRGDVAGMSSPDTNFARALWGYGGLLLLADSTSIARSINNDRRIVGQKTPQGADWIWSPVDDVHTQYLASLGPSTIFRDVNGEGAICGDYRTPNGSAIQGLFYDPQTSQYTALLYGASTRSFAFALNNSRKVVGYTVDGAIDHMTLWDIGAQTATRLGQGVALDINDSDWIVGYDGAGSRFRTPQDGFMNLEDIAEGSDAAPDRWTISNAYRVNNRGEMIAVAAKGNGPKRDVLVSPILRIDDVRLVSASKLQVMTWRAFGRNPDDRFWVDFTVTIGNRVIRRRVTPLRNINADGTYADATPEVFDLQTEGVHGSRATSRSWWKRLWVKVHAPSGRTA